MSNVLLSEIPGMEERLAEARRSEAYLREVAFLDVTVDLCGLECEQYKPKHNRLLLIAENPLLCGGPVTVAHALQFFWIVSPDFTSDPSDAAAFSALCFEVLPDLGDCVAAIDAYLEDAHADRRASTGNEASAPSPIASFTGSLLYEIGAAVGWPRAQIEDTPFAALFQIQRLWDRDDAASKGVRMSFLNRSDKVRRKIMTDHIKAQEALEAANHAG